MEVMWRCRREMEIWRVLDGAVFLWALSALEAEPTPLKVPKVRRQVLSLGPTGRWALLSSLYLVNQVYWCQSNSLALIVSGSSCPCHWVSLRWMWCPNLRRIQTKFLMEKQSMIWFHLVSMTAHSAQTQPMHSGYNKTEERKPMAFRLSYESNKGNKYKVENLHREPKL